MAYGDPKIVVDVQDAERGEILYTDAEGKQRHYYPTLTTWLDVESLHLLTVLDDPRDEAAHPKVSKRFRGVARVDAVSLNVIGDPSVKAHRVEITFEANGWRPKEIAANSDDPSALMAPSGILGAA